MKVQWLILIGVAMLILVIVMEDSAHDSCAEAGGTWLHGRPSKCLKIIDGKIVRITP